MEAPVAGRYAGVLERVDHAWSLYRRHLGAFAAIGLVTDGLVLLLAMVLTGSAATLGEAAFSDRPLPLFVYGTVPALWIVGLLTTAWGIASLLTYTRLAYMEQPPPVRQALLAGLKDIWRTLLIVLAVGAIAFGIILAFSIVAMIPTIITIIVGPILIPLLFYVVVRYSLAIPTHLYERSSLRISLQRGWNLAGTRIWHVIGFYLLIYLISFGLMMLISLAAAPLVALVPEETVETAPPVWLISLYLLIFAPLFITISNWMIVSSGLLFLELRDEQEGHDLWQKLREIEENRGMPTSLPQPLSPPSPET